MTPSRATFPIVRVLTSSPTSSPLTLGMRRTAGITTGVRRMHRAACLVWNQPPQAQGQQPRGSVRILPSINTHRLRAYVSSGGPSSQPPADAGLRGPQPPEYLSPAELAIFEKLRAALVPHKLEVQDISGGCGSMYGIEVVSPHFKGKSIVMMHRMVNQVLKEEMKAWHGVQLKTRAPP